MAFTLIATAGNADSINTATTLDATTSLNVAAGDVLVTWCKHEGANGTFAVAATTGAANAHTFDAGDEINHSNGDLNASFGYVLNAAANATATFRMTTDSRPFRTFIVFQFRPDAGETVTKDASNVAQGTSASASSGTISTTGTDEIVLGGYGEYTATNSSNEQINGVAADSVIRSNTTWGNNFTSAWRRILTATFANGQATATVGNAAWVCGIVAFKSAAAGGQPYQKRLGGVPGMGIVQPGFTHTW